MAGQGHPHNSRWYAMGKSGDNKSSEVMAETTPGAVHPNHAAKSGKVEGSGAGRTPGGATPLGGTPAAPSPPFNLKNPGTKPSAKEADD